MNYFDEPKTNKPLNKKMIGLFMIAYLITLSIPFAWMMYNHHQKEIKKQEETLGKKAIADAMVNLPQNILIRKQQTKKKMVKINRGTTGQADSAGQGTDVFGPDDWVIFVKGDIYLTASTEYGKNGWEVSSSGSVTVPLTAAPNEYFVKYGTSDSPPDEPAMTVTNNFEFEVICVDLDASVS